MIHKHLCSNNELSLYAINLSLALEFSKLQIICLNIFHWDKYCRYYTLIGMYTYIPILQNTIAQSVTEQ